MNPQFAVKQAPLVIALKKILNFSQPQARQEAKCSKNAPKHCATTTGKNVVPQCMGRQKQLTMSKSPRFSADLTPKEKRNH
jgi:hypothetical protein